MTPADTVISKFGGVRSLARLLKKDPSTIHRWKMPAEKGGLGGRIPSKAQHDLLSLAFEHGVDLSAADLIVGTVSVVAAKKGVNSESVITDHAARR